MRIDLRPLVVMLCERWPKAFVLNAYSRKPLKLGIHDDLLQQLGDTVDSRHLGWALRFYVTHVGYMQRLRADAVRVDLDGNPCGSVTAEQARDAKARLLGAKPKRAAEKKPKPPPPKRDGLAALKQAARRRQASATIGEVLGK